MNRIVKRIKSLAAGFWYTFTYLSDFPPYPLAKAFLSNALARSTRKAVDLNQQEMQNFRAQAAFNLDISKDWFSHNIPVWSWAFQSRLRTDSPIRILEIGSFEGLSAHYLLSKFPNSSIICVDTWLGSTEYKTEEGKEIYDFSRVRDRFRKNVQRFGNRVTPYEGTSMQFFAGDTSGQLFDLIYVDGSHEADDVLTDAILGFRRLREGGLMIFDDYMWRFFATKTRNPAAAIETFVSLKREDLEVVHVGYQVIIKRTLTHSSK